MQLTWFWLIFQAKLRWFLVGSGKQVWNIMVMRNPGSMGLIYIYIWYIYQHYWLVTIPYIDPMGMWWWWWWWWWWGWWWWGWGWGWWWWWGWGWWWWWWWWRRWRWRWWWGWWGWGGWWWWWWWWWHMIPQKTTVRKKNRNCCDHD